MFLNYVCSIDEPNDRQRPYRVESTGSRLITEVNQRWACLVLGWETTLETRVLLAFFFAISNDMIKNCINSITVLKTVLTVLTGGVE